MISLTNIPVAELLPHGPPMVLLNRAISYDDSSLVAEVDVHEHTMFCTAAGVPGWVGIEYMAQAVAAHAGCKGRRAGKPPQIGYLLGTRSYECRLPYFPLGRTLSICVESLFVELSLGAFGCRIELDDTIATATINVYQPRRGMLERIDSGRISR